MEKVIGFCEECRDDVECEVSETQMTAELKGAEYSFCGREAHCLRCGSPVYIHEFNDTNLRALYGVYREKNDIVSMEVIEAIPVRYDIGKRPLSLLLGWGEQTFSRYCDGDMPTKQYSDILRRIHDDPAYYAEQLEAGKNNLKSSAAYEKSKRAVDRLMHISEHKERSSRMDIAIEYLLGRCGDITPLALQKALYYIQGFYYAFNREFLFSEDCEAWVHGPVYCDVYLKYKDYRFNAIETKTNIDDEAPTTLERSVFDSVVNNLCCYSGKILERFTHNESPWLEVRGDLPSNAPSHRVIPKEAIGRYFVAVKEKYQMMKPSDIRAYALDMFASV